MRLSKLTFLVLLGGIGGTACAAVPVEEASQPLTRPAAAPVAAAASPSTSTARLSELFYQLQTLQQEVRELRGTVEEQQHTIDKLRRDQKEQYQDLDRRMLGVSQGGSKGAPRTSSRSANTRSSSSRSPSVSSSQPELRDGEVYVNVAGSAGSINADTTAANAPNASNAGDRSGNERAAYTTAFDQMKAREFDESIRSFNRLIVDYPGGVYTGHAFYWLGELYLAKGSDERARAQFLQVVDLYPDHSKVPDALYKMGVAAHRMGDSHKALEYLNRARAEHPGSNAAKLAADYAKEMQ